MFRSAGWSRLAVAFLVGMGLLSAGCSGAGKPSKGNFDKVTKGMSVKEVEDLMGPAKGSIDILTQSVKTWEEGDTGYMVVFKDGKMEDKKSGSKEDMKKAGPPTIQVNVGGDDVGKLTKENLDQIKFDMKKEDVEKLIGKGTPKEGAANTFVWKSGPQQLTLTFNEQGKVSGIQSQNQKVTVP
jgi:hypothetical protein